MEFVWLTLHQAGESAIYAKFNASRKSVSDFANDNV